MWWLDVDACLPARGIVRGSHVVWPESDVPVLCAKARKMSAEEQRNRRRYGAAATERSSRERKHESREEYVHEAIQGFHTL